MATNPPGEELVLIGRFIETACKEIKVAIDEFNKEKNGLVLAYPTHIDIEHNGITISIPLTVQTDG